MPVTEPSPTRPPIKQEGLSWQQIQTQYGSRYQLPSTAPEAVGNRYTTVETPQGLQFYYRKPVPPQQYGRDYEVKNLAVMAKGGGLQPTSVPRPAQFGRDYEVKDLASWAKTVPKPLESTRITNPAFFGPEYHPGIPLAAIAGRPYSVPPAQKHLEDQFGDWIQSIKETYREKVPSPVNPVEETFSSFVFREFWDVGYREKMQAHRKEEASYAATHREEVIQQQRQQTEQLTFAVSVALIAYTGYEVGRSAYSIAKNWQAIKEPFIVETKPTSLIEVETPRGPQFAEVPSQSTPESFSPISMKGPKGERFGGPTEMVPKDIPTPETFDITPTRGAWSNKPIIPKGTRASATISSLLLFEPITSLPTLTSVKIPLASYQPWLITEVALSGMAAGQIANTLFQAPRPTDIATPRITMPTMIQSGVMPRLYQPSKPFATPAFRDIVEFKTEVGQGLAPAQAQTQIQRQEQIQKQIQRQTPTQRQQQRMYEGLFKPPKRKDRESLFDFSGRTRLFYPIKSAREVAGL